MEQARLLSTEDDPRARERDEELALAARSDPVAFAAVYQRHRDAVFRYLRSRTRSEDDAAELTSVTFERALAAIPRYRPSGGGIAAWLLRIARNAAIDAGRHKDALPLAANPGDALTASPETQAIDRERLASLAVAVNRLPALHRDALGLRYAAGLTAREIGEVLGKSEAATQKLISRALATLREDYRHDR